MLRVSEVGPTRCHDPSQFTSAEKPILRCNFLGKDQVIKWLELRPKSAFHAGLVTAHCLSATPKAETRLPRGPKSHSGLSQTGRSSVSLTLYPLGQKWAGFSFPLQLNTKYTSCLWSEQLLFFPPLIIICWLEMTLAVCFCNSTTCNLSRLKAKVIWLYYADLFSLRFLISG